MGCPEHCNWTACSSRIVTDCYSQPTKTVQIRQNRASFGPKYPFWWPWGSEGVPGDHNWSHLPLSAPPGLDSWLPHTLDWHWTTSGPPSFQKWPALAQNAPLWSHVFRVLFIRSRYWLAFTAIVLTFYLPAIYQKWPEELWRYAPTKA